MSTRGTAAKFCGGGWFTYLVTADVKAGSTTGCLYFLFSISCLCSFCVALTFCMADNSMKTGTAGQVHGGSMPSEPCEVEFVSLRERVNKHVLKTSYWGAD